MKEENKRVVEKRLCISWWHSRDHGRSITCGLEYGHNGPHIHNPQDIDTDKIIYCCSQFTLKGIDPSCHFLGNDDCSSSETEKQEVKP